MSYIPSRGDIINIQLDPTKGHEQQGFRPAIVLSEYSYNRTFRLATICAITSKAKGYPFEVKIPEGFDVHGVILANHIRAVDLTERNVRLKCKVSSRKAFFCCRIFTTHYLLTRMMSLVNLGEIT